MLHSSLLFSPSTSHTPQTSPSSLYLHPAYPHLTHPPTSSSLIPSHSLPLSFTSHPWPPIHPPHLADYAEICGRPQSIYATLFVALVKCWCWKHSLVVSQLEWESCIGASSQKSFEHSSWLLTSHGQFQNHHYWPYSTNLAHATVTVTYIHSNRLELEYLCCCALDRDSL